MTEKNLSLPSAIFRSFPVLRQGGTAQAAWIAARVFAKRAFAGLAGHNASQPAATAYPARIAATPIYALGMYATAPQAPALGLGNIAAPARIVAGSACVRRVFALRRMAAAFHEAAIAALVANAAGF
jgi:hypothetical protein